MKNIFEQIPTVFREEIFDNLLVHKQLKIERILSKGHSTAKGEWYDQEQHEWVLLVQGAASIQIEQEPALIHLKAGDHLLIPAHQKHRVEWTSDEEVTIWLALFFDE